MLPIISVVIPIYNSAVYISDCLESVLKQSYKNLEVILINDGSTDDSEEIIKNYLNDTRIIYLSQSNMGPSSARNTGIKYATGEYIVFIDSDDTVEEHYIVSLVKKVLSFKLDLVCCGYIDISEYGIKEHIDFSITQKTSIYELVEMVCQGTGGVLWSKIFKRDLIIRNNIKFDKNLFMSEDLVFVLEYISYCQSFGMIDEYLYKYNRLNQKSISSKISIQYLENYFRVNSRIEQILRSIDLDEKIINNIIGKRIQETVVQLFIKESANLCKVGVKQAYQNIQQIFENQNINKYMNQFTTHKVIYKPLILFLNKQYFKIGMIYGFSVSKIIKIRKKL